MNLSIINEKISIVEAQFNEKKDYLGKIADSMRQLKAEEEKTLDSIKELKGSFKSLTEIKTLLEKSEEKQTQVSKNKQDRKYG